jgi:hypothetical protein
MQKKTSSKNLVRLSLQHAGAAVRKSSPCPTTYFNVDSSVLYVEADAAIYLEMDGFPGSF